MYQWRHERQSRYRSSIPGLGVIWFGRGPPGHGASAGATLMEMAVVLAMVAFIVVLGVTVGSGWLASLRDVTHGATLVEQRDSLAHAARGWYAGTYCRMEPLDGWLARRPPERIELVVSGTEDGAGLSDLRHHLPDQSLVRESAYPADRWQVLVTRTERPFPELLLAWQPAVQDALAQLARRTGGRCALTDDWSVIEDCPDYATGAERLVWNAPLLAGVRQSARTRRLREWLATNAIDCDREDVDADGHPDRDGAFDVECDPDGDGAFGPVDEDSRPGLTRFDSDNDGEIDLDIAGDPDFGGDLVVDVRDWQALGC